MPIDGEDFFSRMKGYKRGADGVPAVLSTSDEERWSEPSTGEFPSTDTSGYDRAVGSLRSRAGHFTLLGEKTDDDGYVNELNRLREGAASRRQRGLGKPVTYDEKMSRKLQYDWNELGRRQNLTQADKRRKLESFRETLSARYGPRIANIAIADAAPDVAADIRERQMYGPLYYLRHPVRGVADVGERVAEEKGKFNDWRTKLGEKGAGNPRTKEELDRENALQAAKLGITPEQLQALNFARLKANAEYGAQGNALAKANRALVAATGSRTGGRSYRSSSPLNYGGGFGLGSMGGPSNVDAWGNTGTVGRGIRASYMGNGMVDMFGRTRDVSRPDFGITPMDVMGNPLYDQRGKLLPQAPRQMWLPTNSGLPQAGWLPRIGAQNDYLSGFKLYGGAGGMGGMGGMGYGNGGGLQGFNLQSIGLGGGLGGFSLGGGLGMGGNLGLGAGYDLGGFSLGGLGDGADSYSLAGKYRVGLGDGRW
jgi:hypothetical protein